MSKKYIYGCISSVKIGFKDFNAIINTKAYQNALDAINIVNNHSKAALSESDIYIDVITASYRIRKNLNKIIEEAVSDDILIIADISELGFNVEELKDNYRKILEKKIGLLILDATSENNLSVYSTVDLDFKRIIDYDETDLNFLCEKLNDAKITTRQGRKKTILPIPDGFKVVYWAFENFFIDEKTTLSNQYFMISKRRFYEFCERYEKSPGYFYEEEIVEHDFKISEKPKRYGAVPKYFPSLLELVEKGSSIEVACSQLDVPPISNITFNRFLIKYNDGNPNKKLLCNASRKYKQLIYSDVHYVPPELKLHNINGI